MEQQKTDMTVSAQRPSALVSLNGGGSWEEALRVFLLNLDAKEPTKRQYGKALTLFFKWTESRGIHIGQISRPDILQYRQELLEGERGLSSQTVAAYIVAIRRFYAWAEAEKLYPDIARGVKSPKIRVRQAAPHAGGMPGHAGKPHE